MRLLLLPLQVLLLLLLCSTPAFSFTALVVSVKDGDTIEVLSNGRATKIRLRGIDCPEKRQAFGYRAKLALAVLTFGQAVKKLKDREWFWIDDEIETWTPAIQHAGLSLDRCIQSNPEGRDELLRIQSTLVSRLEWIRTQTRDGIRTEDAA